MPSTPGQPTDHSAELTKPDWVRPEMTVISVERTLNSGFNSDDGSGAMNVS